MGTQVAITRTAWAGTSGGAGLSQWAWHDATGAEPTVTEAQAAVNATRAFWDAIKLYIPNEVVLTVLPTVDLYDWQTGTLYGSHTVGTAPATVTGTGASSYNMAAGVKVNHQTEIIANGRRVRGTTYVVPADGASYTATGGVSTGVKTAIDAAGIVYLASMSTAGNAALVWSRPTSPGPSTDGFTSVVSSMKTADKAAILRGRRD